MRQGSGGVEAGGYWGSGYIPGLFSLSLEAWCGGMSDGAWQGQQQGRPGRGSQQVGTGSVKLLTQTFETGLRHMVAVRLSGQGRGSNDAGPLRLEGVAKGGYWVSRPGVAISRFGRGRGCNKAGPLPWTGLLLMGTDCQLQKKNSQVGGEGLVWRSAERGRAGAATRQGRCPGRGLVQIGTQDGIAGACCKLMVYCKISSLCPFPCPCVNACVRLCEHHHAVNIIT